AQGLLAPEALRLRALGSENEQEREAAARETGPISQQAIFAAFPSLLRCLARCGLDTRAGRLADRLLGEAAGRADEDLEGVALALGRADLRGLVARLEELSRQARYQVRRVLCLHPGTGGAAAEAARLRPALEPSMLELMAVAPPHAEALAYARAFCR